MAVCNNQNNLGLEIGLWAIIFSRFSLFSTFHPFFSNRTLNFPFAEKSDRNGNVRSDPSLQSTMYVLLIRLWINNTVIFIRAM